MKQFFLVVFAVAIASAANAGGVSVTSSQPLQSCSLKTLCSVELKETKTPGVFEFSVKTMDGKPAVMDGGALVALMKKSPDGKAVVEATW